VRSGDLDFALLKPIDTQFLVSLAKFDWSALSNFVFASGLLTFAMIHIDHQPSLGAILLYPFYIACSVAILYSLTIGARRDDRLASDAINRSTNSGSTSRISRAIRGKFTADRWARLCNSSSPISSRYWWW